MIHKEIKILRKKFKLTQIEFAKRAGVGLRFLRELEQGKSTIRMDKLNDVLDFLGVHLELIRNTSEYFKIKDKFKYNIRFNKALKEKIRKRDNYKCQVCGISQKKNKARTKKKLSIHHVDYDKENCDETNLVSLCQKCHGRTNKNREIWTKFFTSIIETLTQ